MKMSTERVGLLSPRPVTRLPYSTLSLSQVKLQSSNQNLLQSKNRFLIPRNSYEIRCPPEMTPTTTSRQFKSHINDLAKITLGCYDNP